MSESLTDLIIHPVRLRILQLLRVGPLTTRQLAGALPDVPASSIYRHVKLLHRHNLIRVAETRRVRGLEERVYALARRPHIGEDDLAGLTADDHVRSFTLYTTALIHDFANYVRGAAADFRPLDDRAGYSEALVYASAEEMDAVAEAINAALAPLLANGPGADRRLRKLSVISHPVVAPEPPAPMRRRHPAIRADAE